MPKKMGSNTKAVEAKVRKEEKKKSENDAKQKQIEDEFWKDDDKNVNKKAQRKEEKEVKRLQQLEKKKELQTLHDSEMTSIKEKKEPVSKVTHFQLEEMKKKTNEAANIKPKPQIEEPITDNDNKIICDGDEARTIDDAIKILKVEDNPGDRHVEKRVKAAYLIFEERRMPELKVENPGLRLTQLKQLLSKEFDKSAENPKNQANVSYNFKPQKHVPENPQ